MADQVLTTEEFLEDVDGAVDRVIDGHEVLHVHRRGGRDFVVLSAEDWGSIEETLYLNSIPGMAKSIKDAMNEPLEDGVPLEEVEW